MLGGFQGKLLIGIKSNHSLRAGLNQYPYWNADTSINSMLKWRGVRIAGRGGGNAWSAESYSLSLQHPATLSANT